MRFFIGLIILSLSNLAVGSIDDYFPENRVTSSNYGNTGLLEIPSARFAKEGTLRFGISNSYPNTFTFLTANPFPWLEATYRYTEIKDRLYGPYAFSGNQTYKDKGFDLKFLLAKESYILPSISVGLRDIAGTGIFSSEYLVASKEIKDFDVSIGIGWGRLGQLGNISNPLARWSKDFNSRNSLVGVGGTFNQKDWFSGERASVFGGLEYKFKKYGLRLKLEYDPTKPDTGYGISLPSKVDSRFNIGLTYNIGNLGDLGLSFERGNQFRFSFNFRGNFSQEAKLKKIDPPKIKNTQNTKISHRDQRKYLRNILFKLKDEQIFLQGGTVKKNKVEVSVSQTKFNSQPLAVGRTARVIDQLSTDDLDELQVNIMNGDIETSSFSFSRENLDKALKNKISVIELVSKTKIFSSTGNQKYKSHKFRPTVNFPEHFWGMSPALKHHIGGPEGFYLGQLWWRINSNLKFTRNLTLSTVIGLDIYNNFDELNNKSNSTLPHVRSDIQEYLKEGSTNIARMKLDYIWSPKNDLFIRTDLGLIEEMFGGLGGEVLYRPFNKRYAIGFTGHYLKQREYKQLLGFQDYKVFSGHLNTYFKLPQDVLLQVHAGRYLAKDTGITFDISRRFKTGFRLGVFATKTNISREEFGEGSFNKGFYFSIPLDLYFSDYRSGNIGFSMSPMTRDGGAMLNNHNSLFGIFGETNRDSIDRDINDLIK